MNHPTRALASIIPLVALVIHFGCGIEVDDDRDRHLLITGKVTYQGNPVKRGAIHFLPVDPANPSASGTINDGEIRDVYTRTPGDGLKSGKYRIAITSFDEEFLQSVAKRDGRGADPVEVGRAANKIKKLIPVRYSNVRESGLSAEFSPDNHSLNLDLVD